MPGTRDSDTDDGDPGAGRPSAVAADPEAWRELCHDLAGVASTIRALVAAVRSECRLPAGAHRRLEQIAAEAWFVDELCREGLGARTGSAPPARLDEMAGEVVAAARAHHPGVQLVASPVEAAIDAVALRRVLTNLVDNACRAAGEDGQVVVTVGVHGGEARIEVADTGPGFGGGPPGRASLGLTIVRTLVEHHGGRVEVGGAGVGGGRVSVVLPPPPVGAGSPPASGMAGP